MKNLMITAAIFSISFGAMAQKKPADIFKKIRG